jgi:hypothetical protein
MSQKQRQKKGKKEGGNQIAGKCNKKTKNEIRKKRKTNIKDNKRRGTKDQNSGT